MRSVDIAYAAGFFDGEGHVEIRRHLQGVNALLFTVSVGQNDIQPLDWLQTLFGGHIYHPHGNKRSNAHVWTVSGKDAYKFLEVILPFLMVKQAEAKEACERWIGRQGAH